MGGLNLINKLKLPLGLVIELDSPISVPTIKQPVVFSASVRRLIVHKKHILPLTPYLGLHDGVDVLLPDIPYNLILAFLERERGPYLEPGVREVEIILLSLMEEYTQKPAVKRHEVDLGPASSNVKRAVLKHLTGLPASEAV